MQQDAGMALDFKGLNDSLLFRAKEVLPQWFPGGKFISGEFVVAGLDGGSGGSLSINWRKGVWKDFATDETGGDLISLYAAQNGMTQGQAFKALSQEFGGQPAPRPVQISRPAKKQVQAMPPEDAPRPAFDHARHGPAVAVYEYTTATGAIIGYISRHEPPDARKQFIPWTWGDNQWQCVGFVDPRPLYGLDAIAAAPTKTVLLVEGEKAAEAAKRICGHVYVPVTWPGGAAAVNKVDWAALGGRKVLIWPDADEPGIRAANAIAELLSDKASAVRIIDVSGMPDKWDAADAAASGMAYDQWTAWAKPRLAKYDPKTTDEKERAAVQAEGAGLQSRVELWNHLGLELAGEGKARFRIWTTAAGCSSDGRDLAGRCGTIPSGKRC